MLRFEDPAQSRALANEVLTESQALEYHKGIAEANCVLAKLAIESDFEKVLQHTSVASEHYGLMGDLAGESEVKLILYRYFERENWMVKAHYALVDAIEISGMARSGRIHTEALLEMSRFSRRRGELVKAEQFLIRAEESSTRLKMVDDRLRHMIRVERERLHFLKGNRAIHPSIVETGARFFDQAHHHVEAFGAWVLLIEIWAHQAAEPQCKGAVKEALRFTREHPHVYAGELWSVLARLMKTKGRLRISERLLQKTLSAASLQGDTALQIDALSRLSSIQYELGHVHLAYQTLEAHVRLKEAHLNQDTERHMQEMQAAYRVKTVETESENLKQKNDDLARVNKRLQSVIREKDQLQRDLERLVSIDDLTGVYNRRHVLSLGQNLVARFHKQQDPGVVMVLDIDHFKVINDTFGHAAGDEALRRFVKSCQRALRPTDIFGRLGGEEFGIFLSRTQLDVALRVAERLRLSIRATKTNDLIGDRQLTASIGVCAITEKHKTVESVLHDADVALYEAKNAGRDQFRVATGEQAA
ncbi:MAG TPA: GGDEF domain-containing protein [Fimbriimonas sp.]|nr:GGDEF domain-containing protein [Fimbriimonas sp.]